MTDQRPVLALAAAALLAGCASEPVFTQPYSFVTTEQAVASSTARGGFSMTVDGHEVVTGDSVPVPPGLRTVAINKAQGASSPEMSMTFEAQPCKRYVIVATRSAGTDDDWKPVLNRTEPVGECERKFKMY